MPADGSGQPAGARPTDQQPQPKPKPVDKPPPPPPPVDKPPAANQAGPSPPARSGLDQYLSGPRQGSDARPAVVSNPSPGATRDTPTSPGSSSGSPGGGAGTPADAGRGGGSGTPEGSPGSAPSPDAGRQPNDQPASDKAAAGGGDGDTPTCGAGGGDRNSNTPTGGGDGGDRTAGTDRRGGSAGGDSGPGDRSGGTAGSDGPAANPASRGGGADPAAIGKGGDGTGATDGAAATPTGKAPEAKGGAGGAPPADRNGGQPSGSGSGRGGTSDSGPPAGVKDRTAGTPAPEELRRLAARPSDQPPVSPKALLGFTIPDVPSDRTEHDGITTVEITAPDGSRATIKFPTEIEDQVRWDAHPTTDPDTGKDTVELVVSSPVASDISAPPGWRVFQELPGQGRVELQIAPVPQDALNDRIQELASTLVQRAQGPAATVTLSPQARAQLEEAAHGPPPGSRQITVHDGKTTVVLGDSAEKLLAALVKLSDGGKRLELVSWVRGAKHGPGMSVDIRAYDGHRFNERNPAESREAAKALVRALPRGHFGFGVPRLPTKDYLPDATPVERARHIRDMKNHPDFYDRRVSVPASRSAPKNALPENRRLEDPHFDQKDRSVVYAESPSKDWLPREVSVGKLMDQGSRDAFNAAAERGTYVYPFADGPGLGHLQVNPPRNK